MKKQTIISLVVFTVLALMTGTGLAFAKTYVQNSRQPEQAVIVTSAWAWQLADLQPQSDGTYIVTFNIMYSTVPATASQVTVTIDPNTDTPLTIRTKTTDAIVTQSTAFGITVPRTRIILYEWQRGL